MAIDFGTSNTVIATWNETSRSSATIHIPDYGRFIQQGEEQISLIPSLINYGKDGTRWIGQQVRQRGNYHARNTFRWMKRYITHRSPAFRQINDKRITQQQAGKDFLSSVLLVAAGELSLQDEEVAFSVPVEAYEHYEDWLSRVAEDAGIYRFRLIDEPSAAALGYGANIQPGNIYLIFDFGGGTMHASVVKIEEEKKSAPGRRCRVLGKSGRDIGGSTIDQWLFEDILKQHHYQDIDPEIRRISSSLLVACEGLKEQLSFDQQASLSVMDPETGDLLTAHYSQDSFENLLENKGLFTDIHQMVRGAMGQSQERGFGEDLIHSVLMVGGSSQIPSIQTSLRRMYGSDKVHFNRPLDAVARGAAAFVAGIDFYDHIQHNYAIKFYNPEKGQHDYRIVVPQGTPYPTQEPVARLTVKAAYDAQQQLGLAIYEIGNHQKRTQNVEIVFDPTGAVRLMEVTPDEKEHRSYFWMNEDTPTFLTANPPAAQGQPRFEVEFSIDRNKRLMITVRDLLTQKLTHDQYPVVKLS
jgi:molecular chaperone DnaK (HSP70)